MSTAPSPLTAPFWAAAADRRLVRQVCDRCGENVFTPRAACPRCWSESLTWTDSDGVGTVHSATAVHRAPDGSRATPYVVAIVDLDEGWHLMSNIVGCPPDVVDVGLRVSVRWESRDGRTVPVFGPLEEARS